MLSAYGSIKLATGLKQCQLGTVGWASTAGAREHYGCSLHLPKAADMSARQRLACQSYHQALSHPGPVACACSGDVWHFRVLDEKVNGQQQR